MDPGFVKEIQKAFLPLVYWPYVSCKWSNILGIRGVWPFLASGNNDLYDLADTWLAKCEVIVIQVVK